MDYNRDPEDWRREEEWSDSAGSKGRILKLWKMHHKKVMWGVVFLFCGYVAIEIVHQARIQMAIMHNNDGEYVKALDSLKGLKLGLFRNNTAEAVTKRAQYFISVDELDKAIERFNWYIAQKHLKLAVDCSAGIDSFNEDMQKAITSWHHGLEQHLEEGELAKCRTALDYLTEVSFTDDEQQTQVNTLSYEMTLNLVREFSEYEDWASTLDEVAIMADHPEGKEGEAEQLKKLVRQQMDASLQAAVNRGEFNRAEALLHLIHSHFPETSIDKQDFLENIKFSKQLSAGEEYEQEGSFDKALEAYDLALKLRPGNTQAFKKIYLLRERLRGYTKENGYWEIATTKSKMSELQEAIVICRNCYRKTLYRNGKPITIFKEYMSSRTGLKGYWSLVKDPRRSEPAWVIRGTVTAPNQNHRRKAYQGVRIGALLTDRYSQPLTGKVIKLPLLLQGQEKHFEIVLPCQANEHTLRIKMDP